MIIGNIETSLEHAEQTEAQLDESYNLTLEGWVKALEFRDRETEGHCRRVANLCVQLADQLGLPDEEITLIYRGSLLHDIGKMAIPDSILFKPGPLDETEWEVMHKHPLYAKEMLESIPYLKTAIPIPYCHHERWDGGGYPLGLKGEEIPLPSRLFTIIDHWEALSSDRPYRKAFTKDEIVVYIENNAGIIFDPRITRIFLNMILAPN
jgi:putative nucleotidyltransferase with HDIG domain